VQNGVKVFGFCPVIEFGFNTSCRTMMVVLDANADQKHFWLRIDQEPAKQVVDSVLQ
jgi:hypothetical protein